MNLNDIINDINFRKNNPEIQKEKDIEYKQKFELWINSRTN